MADGVVIKIDGDDEGFREKLAGVSDAAKGALSGVNTAAKGAGEAIGDMASQSESLLTSLSGLSAEYEAGISSVIDSLAAVIVAAQGANGAMEGFFLRGNPGNGDEANHSRDVSQGDLLNARDALDYLFDSLDSVIKNDFSRAGESREGDRPTAISSNGDISRDFSGGVNKESKNASGAVASMLSNALGELDAAKADAQKSGANLGQGFADGMAGKLSVVVARAVELARAAVNAIDAAVENASPSKVARRSGEFLSEGFALGIANGVQDVKNAGRIIGDAGITGLNVANLHLTAGMPLAASRNASSGVDYDRLAEAASSRQTNLYINSKKFAVATAADENIAIARRRVALNRGRGGL